MNLIQNYQEFYEFLAKLLLCAPDDFPVEDYLPTEKQLNLQRAYDELDKGLIFVKQRLNNDEKYQRVVADIKESKMAYEVGNESKGAQLIQKLRRDLSLS